MGTESFHWESPGIGIGFLALAVALVALEAWRQHRRGLGRSRIATLFALRIVPVGVIALLLAQPVRVQSREDPKERAVVLLLDRSASMALADAKGRTRYADALAFARETVVPTLQSAGFRVESILFDGAAQPADGPALAAASPVGEKTDLGGAISAALALRERPPLAIVALTDGASNQPQSNRPAVGALLAAKVPFIGVGFGTEHGVRTLNLREVDAPANTPPNSRFRVSARIEATAAARVSGRRVSR
jgi:hypothetical protein